jgi:hypothetical protein
MPYLIILFLSCHCIVLSSCTNEPVTSPPPASWVKPLPEESPFWKEVCRSGNFPYMYHCSRADIYQIELYQHFKDFVIVTIDISDSTKDVLYYNRFHVTLPSGKKNKGIKFLNVVNPVTNDSIVFYYRRVSKLVAKPKDEKMNIFLSKTIWELSNNEGEKGMFDPEVWTLKARSGDKVLETDRQLFKDSTYYSNIQHILDICQIRDYQYPRK